MTVTKVCAVDGCGKPVKSRGWCGAHNAKVQKYGDPLGCAPPRPFVKCAVDGCDKAKRANGFCGRHNHRNNRHGDPTMGRGERTPNGVARQWLIDHASHQGDECLTWPFANRGNGYGAIVSSDGRTLGAHREMCILVHGEPPEPNYDACHSCGKGHLACVNPRHLSWGTKSKNSGDRVSHGTDHRGTKSPLHKITDEDVKKIRALRGEVTQSVIGEHYGIAQAHVSKIQTGGVWSWLK